jgi:hypothetical protein
MQITNVLIPVAAAAVGTAVQGVSSAVHRGISFAKALEHAAAAPDPAPEVATQGAAGSADTSLDGSRRALQYQFDKLRKVVSDQLTQSLTARGVDLSEPPVLAFDAQGRLLEVGNHWDRALVEQALEEDPRLQGQISQLMDQARALWETRPPGGGWPAGAPLRLLVTPTEAIVQVV